MIFEKKLLDHLSMMEPNIMTGNIITQAIIAITIEPYLAILLIVNSPLGKEGSISSSIAMYKNLSNIFHLR